MKLACPCGNVIWNGCDGDETAYYFFSNKDFADQWETGAFFEMEGDVATEMWYCSTCDRLMAFDNGSDSVTRYLRRVDSESVPPDLGSVAHEEGICYSNLLFNEVDEHFTRRSKDGKCPEYNFWGFEDDGPDILTPKVMQEEVFSHKNGRFLNWWYADMYQDWLVFFSPFDPGKKEPPVKAWMRYDQVWPE